MDTHRQSDAVNLERGRKLGVMGGRRCAECGIVVDWRVQQFCQGQRERFAGRILCRPCQGRIPRGS